MASCCEIVVQLASGIINFMDIGIICLRLEKIKYKIITAKPSRVKNTCTYFMYE